MRKGLAKKHEGASRARVGPAGVAATARQHLPDPTLCPRCGAPNACVMAAGDPESRCWCESVIVPGALLDALPDDAKGVACLCAACIAASASGSA